MAKIKTASVHIRIKEDTKKQAEAILKSWEFRERWR